MVFFVFFWVFLFGVVVGSFLNVVALRWGTGRSFLTGRSRCPACERILSALELIPLVSYVLQRGRCRACDTSLSLRYPLVELATGLIFGLIFLALKPTLALVSLLTFFLYLAIASVLIVIVLYDFEHLIIPDALVYTFIAITALLLFVNPVTQAFALPSLVHVIAGPFLFAPFFLLWYFSHGAWIGLGDGKLAWGIGWMLGLLPGLSAVVFAFWMGATTALIIMASQRILLHKTHHRLRETLFGAHPTLTMKSEIPFGPFLIAGAAFVFLTGWTLESLFTLLQIIF